MPRSVRALPFVPVVVALLGLASAAGCGALVTRAPDPADVMDGPLDGLTAAERAAFVEGDEQFERPFAVTDGLGPLFNDISCAACHSGDGRGRLEHVLVRFSSDDDPQGTGAPQLQDRAIPGADPETLPSGEALSRRLPPPVFGMGLLETIPDDTLLALADPGDANGDGVSGRVSWVTPPDFVPAHEPGAGPGPVVGRFGRKAQVSSLLQQVVDAYHQDIGITTDFRPVENVNPRASRPTESADRVADPELPASTLRAVLHYVRLLAPPAPGALTPARERGRDRFAEWGCATCHVPVLRTGPSTTAALAHRDVALYSDLLLHDMGDALADGRADGAANGREWRTAPLWGLRVARDFLRGELFLLHDGRARTLDEAIRLHGGEAQAARDAYVGATEAERTDLLDFVGSR